MQGHVLRRLYYMYVLASRVMLTCTTDFLCLSVRVSPQGMVASHD